MKLLRVACVTVLFAACETPDPLNAALPALPPEGGAAVAAAGRLTVDNFDREKIPGPASQGLAGDYFMRNDKVRLVIQAPGRAIGPCPFGGNIIDFDRADKPIGDQLGEVSPFLQLGRTIAFTDVEVVRDGSKGGPAVIRMRGHDAKNDFIDVPGIGGFAIAIQDDYRATVDLKWQAAVTYILMPGTTSVRMIYSFYNPNKLLGKTMWGVLSDTGADVEVYHPHLGYGELGFNDIFSSLGAPPGTYGAFQGQGIAYGIVPVFADKSIRGASIAISGVDVEVFDIVSVPDAFGDIGSKLVVKGGGTETREVDLVLGSELGDVVTQHHAIRGDATVALSGTVNGTAPAGARVVVLLRDVKPEAALVATLTAGSDGKFAAALPAGRYTLIAEGDAWRRSAPVTVDLPGPEVQLTIPEPALLSYTIKDRAGALIPGKISVVGAPAAPLDRRFRDVGKDALPNGIAAWGFSLGGDSSLLNGVDKPISLTAGRYRVVISRGPEWSRHEQVIDVSAGGSPRVDAVLDQVVPTPGYVSADFHQHAWWSPDAPVPPRDRVAAYLADGTEFISSSEHDVHFDYAPVIAELGAEALLVSTVGVETTPWDYGHFIAFPLPVDKLSPNGGALDWAGGEEAPSLSPRQIFEGLKKQGAKVLQVNHPRAPAGAFSDFQQNFDRAGLRFDFSGRTFFGDKMIQPLNNLALDLPADESVFTETFNSVEIYNGFRPIADPVDGERPDALVDTNLRDWMNFLSFGFTPTAVGDSDSHIWYAVPSGIPRTLVKVPLDQPQAPGIVDDVVSTMTGARLRDVIVTNGPFLQMTVDGKGLGATVASAGPLAIHVEVKSADWAPFDTVEIFANNTFDVPLPKGTVPPALPPVLCFTSKAMPPARCKAAVGGARSLTVRPVTTAPGFQRLEATVDVSVTVDELLTNQRAGAMGRDLWVVARVTGSTGLFPVIPLRIDGKVPAADLVQRGLAALDGVGVPALAFTNPIFVDSDGNGWRAPFAP